MRVRFAPSPTGYLHIGSARTFIFNWLYARRNQGAMILRIKAGEIINASRAALTGQTVDPSAFAVFIALGRERALRGLRNA